jgi:hypothetical protein
MNWDQTYIKEEFWSALAQYKCTEASFQLSKLKAVGLVLRSVIFGDQLKISHIVGPQILLWECQAN